MIAQWGSGEQHASLPARKDALIEAATPTQDYVTRVVILQCGEQSAIRCAQTIVKTPPVTNSQAHVIMAARQDTLATALSRKDAQLVAP